MNIFDEVKERSDISDVVRAIGLNLNKANKCLCPFHNEKTPSFSISRKKQIFKCFGCGEKGDSIALVAKLKGLSNYESALYINEILNLGIKVENDRFTKSNKKTKDDNERITTYNNSKLIIEAFNNWENKTFLLLSDYRRYLAEKNDEETAEMLTIVDYYLDIFTSDDIEEKLSFYKYNKKVVQVINERFIKKNS